MTKSKTKFGISYIDTGSPIHQLNGITKFVVFMAWITIVLTTFDLRLITGLLLIGLLLLKLSRVPFSVYRTLLVTASAILSINAFFIFLLAPNQGSEILGTATPLFSFSESHVLSRETLYYLTAVTLKYFSMFPIALLFVFSTHPSEFAASLNRLGVPYKIAYAVSLTLRYLPEIKKDFVNIMHAQQARGVELGKGVSIYNRLKNVSKILTPLIFSSLDRAEEISNAMELRGFGRHKTRTWYSLKPLTNADYLVISGFGVFTVIAIAKRILEKDLFWYPF
ncbi:energy-coupling factor transporter transmembrane component T family protein [Vibrio sonorensis]|uniref:energy-coupling factor transporter transmembrane component T family protein n=1 Tax=Vibrio sonorensis TaxID=1004316 RepID=UPI0008D934DF|nr:energy-coupling factor transporter transmembrane component T [Vibrio sonorensis]